MTRPKWKRVEYNIAGIIHAKGMGKPQILKVFGRAMGLRSDGQTFWAAYDLPWIWPKKFQWTKAARKRLDSFLDRRCGCMSGQDEAITCEFHRDLISEWNKEDDKRLGFNRFSNEYAPQQHKELPAPGPRPGPIDQLAIVNFDYPWIRKYFKDELLRCLLCKQTMDPQEYPNIFVRKHSFCGETRAQQDQYWNRKGQPKALPAGESDVFDEIDKLIREGERGKTIDA